MPTSRMATMSNTVATGRRIKGREGLKGRSQGSGVRDQESFSPRPGTRYSGWTTRVGSRRSEVGGRKSEIGKDLFAASLATRSIASRSLAHRHFRPRRQFIDAVGHHHIAWVKAAVDGG